VGPGRHWQSASSSANTEADIHFICSTNVFSNRPMCAAGPPKAIRQTHSIFSVSAILLVTRTVYSQCLPPYCSLVQYIISDWHPIGHTHSIFSVTGNLLVTRTVYSQCLPSCWEHTQYILSACRPIGHTHSVFSVTGILLGSRTVYSQCLPSYWSHAQYILSDCQRGRSARRGL
jgi:hypothetical protein